MREDSIATSFRKRRIFRMLNMLDLTKKVNILDIGGTFSYWVGLGTLYRHENVEITIINLEVQNKDLNNLHMRQGDACALREYDNNSFDLVHSNSVIEHVGNERHMAAMAGEIRRLAPKHFVQTPDYACLIEPHYKLPFIHWLPEETKIKVLRAFKKVPRDREQSLASVRGTNLLGVREFKSLFPESTIWRERVFGLPKSLVAIRDW